MGQPIFVAFVHRSDFRTPVASGAAGRAKVGLCPASCFQFLPLFCLRFPAVDYTGAICQVLVHGVHFILYRSIKAVIRCIYTTDACFVPYSPTPFA